MKPGDNIDKTITGWGRAKWVRTTPIGTLSPCFNRPVIHQRRKRHPSGTHLCDIADLRGRGVAPTPKICVPPRDNLTICLNRSKPIVLGNNMHDVGGHRRCIRRTRIASCVRAAPRCHRTIGMQCRKGICIAVQLREATTCWCACCKLTIFICGRIAPCRDRSIIAKHRENTVGQSCSIV